MLLGSVWKCVPLCTYIAGPNEKRNHFCWALILPETNILAPKNGCLEFLLGPSLVFDMENLPFFIIRVSCRNRISEPSTACEFHGSLIFAVRCQVNGSSSRGFLSSTRPARDFFFLGPRRWNPRIFVAESSGAWNLGEVRWRFPYRSQLGGRKLPISV